MEQVPRQQYTKEFREQAVRLVLEQPLTIPEAAQTPEHVGQDARALGVSRSAGPARDAVQVLESASRPASELARELGIRRNQLYKWQRELQARGTGAFPGSGARKERTTEIARLKRELAEARMERDILKNGPHGLPCPFCIETSGGTILQRVDSGR